MAMDARATTGSPHPLANHGFHHDWLEPISRCWLGEYVTHDFGGLARGLAHGDARRLERVLLVLGGALPPETMAAGVAHLLAFGGGETGDVGDNRLGHVLLGPCGGVLFGEAADFADHHDSLGVGVGFECLQGFQQRRADDRSPPAPRHAVKPISDNSPMSW